jgi:spore coat protein U-like protein
MGLVSRTRLLGAIALAAVAPGVAAAQSVGSLATATTTFAVTAQVSTTCFVTANALNFGPYTGVQLDGTTTLAATCSSGTPYELGLNQGTHAGATVTTRAMDGSGGQFLTYSLFQDAGRTTNWGNTPNTDTVNSSGTGAAQSFTVFGRIPAAQFPSSGSYSDTITVTLTF